MGHEVYTAIKLYFGSNNAAYREIEHSPAAATEDYHQALGCRYEQQAKCLFLQVTGGAHEYVICTLPASYKANMKLLKTLLNARDVKFASRDALKQHTNCDFGELAPTASLFGMPLLMAEELLREDEIFLNAGRLDVSFVISPQTLVRLENPVLFRAGD
jgi:Ala-tRNA(Pro) deacylase